MISFLTDLLLFLLLALSPFAVLWLWRRTPILVKRVLHLLFFWPLHITSEPGRPRSKF